MVTNPRCWLSWEGWLVAGVFSAVTYCATLHRVLGYTHDHDSSRPGPAHRHRPPPPRTREGNGMTATERTRLLYLLRYGHTATERQAARDQLTDRRAR